MEHFFGVVEDRQDPLQIGRVRIRIHGIHTDDKTRIATPDLPWAHVLLPTTTAGLGGLGIQHGLVEGTTVYGFFRDGKTCQDPVILGVQTGITVDGIKETITDELITRTVDRGFSDPRRATVADYEGTPDGKNPQQDSRRPHGLTTALDTAPRQPESLEITYDATGSSFTDVEPVAPFYPLYTNESDLSRYARGATLNKTLSDVPMGDFPDSPASPVYPYNKVLETESGHVFEVDDTLGAERISEYHRSGTFREVHPDGSVVTRVVNDNYTVICKDERVYIAGNVDLDVEKGNVTINVNTGNVICNVNEGNVDAYVKGNVTGIVDGNVVANVGGNIDATVGGNVSATVDGNIDGSVGGTASLKVSGTTTVDTPTTNWKGNINVTGNINVNGKVDISGKSTAADHISGGISGKNHKHRDTPGLGANITSKPI